LEHGKEYVDAESEDDAMSLKKRNIGRRVAGIGVGVALMVLGLQAPAFAAVPTALTVSPNSGPAGCVVKVTGTNFKNPNVTSVKFDANTNPATFTIQSDTELWTTVPGGGLVSPLTTNISIDNGSGTVAVIAFTRTAATVPGGCAPTVTSYTPTCGLAGAQVVIAGTNLLKSDDGTGGDVRFAPYPALPAGAATQSNAIDQSPESLTVFVKTGAADGPIRVSTWNDTVGQGSALGATIFQVPPPDCAPVTGNEHARALTFKLKKSGKASGVLSSTEDPAFTKCVAAAPVKIQKKKKGDGWKTKATATTDDTGSYSATINAKPGKYRALAPAVSLGDPVTDNCLKAKSATRKIG
jgi:hypothetical protein